MTKRKLTFYIFVIALLIVGTVGVSIAQYIDRQEKQNLALSNSFFFQMNYENNISNTFSPYYVVGNQINIRLSNNDGLNINSSNITYSVTVENSIGTDITESLIIAGNDGVLTGGVISTDSISISNISLDTLYVVKILSTSPYTKTLSAKFMLRSVNNTYYTITDTANSNYVSLNLYIGNVLPTSNLTINYGLNLAPDNTNELMENWVDGTSGTIAYSSLLQNSTYTFVFFKQDTSLNYSTVSTLLDLTSTQTITFTEN